MWHGRVAAVALLACCAACAAPTQKLVRTELGEALGGHRPTVGLLTGTKPAPYRSPSRERGLPDAALLLAAVNAERAFKAAQTEVTIGDMGVAALLLGDSDKAVQLLELCARANPGRASPLADLSAAYLEVALRSDRPDLFPQALEAASEALHIEPGNPVALFNRAQALVGLRYRELATRAWADFDAGRKEASQETMDLTPLGISSADMPAARAAYVTIRRAAFRLASARTTGRFDPVALREARRNAQEILDFNGDRYWFDVLDAVESPDNGSAAHAVQVLERIEDATRSRDLKEARKGLAALAEARPPAAVALALDYQRLLIAFYAGTRSGLAPRFESLERDAQKRGYLALEVQGAWMTSLVTAIEGAPIGSILSRLGRIERQASRGPVELEGLIRSRVAGAYRRVGAYRDSWRTQAGGTWQVESLSELLALSEALEDQGLVFGAASIIEMALETDHKSDRLSRVQAELGAVRLWHRLGQPTRARSHLLRATRQLGDMGEDPLREALAGELALARLESGPEGFNERLFEEAREYLARARDKDRLPRLLLARARYRGNWAGRIDDLKDALQLAIAQAASKRADQEGDRRLAREIADDLVDEYVRKGDIKAIVAIQEEVRARSKEPSPEPAGKATDQVVLRYVMWKDELAVIAGTGERRRFHRLNCGVAELGRLVSRYHLLLGMSGQAAEARNIEHKLTDLLLSPVKDLMVRSDELLLLPDGPIWNVPFANLFNPSNHTDRIGSTWATTVASSEKPRSSTGGSAGRVSALAVAYSPRVGSAAALPFAEAEAKAVAAVYADGLALTGPEATREALQRRAVGREVVHIAAHAFSSLSVPARAALFLAPGPAHESGIVTFDDPFWRELGRGKVVVLSACVSARGQIRFAAAPPGLVSLLLETGAWYVIASTVPVDDAASLSSMRVLHHYLREGMSPERAVLAAHRASPASEFAQSSGMAVYR